MPCPSVIRLRYMVQGAVRPPGGAVAAGDLRPRRPPLPVLRRTRRLDRPRRAALEGRPAHVGERGRRVPAVQPHQARSHPRRGRHASRAARVGRRAPPPGSCRGERYSRHLASLPAARLLTLVRRTRTGWCARAARPPRTSTTASSRSGPPDDLVARRHRRRRSCSVRRRTSATIDLDGLPSCRRRGGAASQRRGSGAARARRGGVVRRDRAGRVARAGLDDVHALDGLARRHIAACSASCSATGGLGARRADSCRRRGRRTVCFDGLGARRGPASTAHKLVGISQRRTRDAARFQVLLVHVVRPGRARRPARCRASPAASTTSARSPRSASIADAIPPPRRPPPSPRPHRLASTDTEPVAVGAHDARCRPSLDRRSRVGVVRGRMGWVRVGEMGEDG